MLAVAGRNTATVYHELALFALVARKDLYFIQVGNNSIESLLCNNRGWESQSFRRQDPRCRCLDLPLLMGLTEASDEPHMADEVLEAWFAAHELTRASADDELSLLLFQMETVILSPRGHSLSLTNPTNTGGGRKQNTAQTVRHAREAAEKSPTPRSSLPAPLQLQHGNKKQGPFCHWLFQLLKAGRHPQGHFKHQGMWSAWDVLGPTLGRHCLSTFVPYTTRLCA